MLFALQAAIGAIIIGFFIGRYTKNKSEREQGEVGGNGGSKKVQPKAEASTEPAVAQGEKYYYR